MRLLYILCVALLFIIFNAQASDSQTNRATVLCITRPVIENVQEPGTANQVTLTAQTEDQKLQRLINNSIKLTLEQAGLQVILDSELTAAPALQVKSTGEKAFDANSIYQLAKQLQVDFTLASSFTSRDNEVAVRFNWYNTHQSVLSKTLLKNLSLELRFDEAVSQAIGELLVPLKHELATVTPYKKAVTTKVVQSLPRESDQNNLTVSKRLPQQDPDSVTNESARINPLARAKNEEKATYWEVITGFAPFLAIGQITDFFKLSYAPTLNISFLINLSAGQLALGMYTGFNIFQVDELMGAGLNYFIPVGADVRFETNTKPLRFYVHVAGGPTILTINLDNTVPRSTLIAFALGGIGLCIPFGTHFGLALDSSFIAFFDHGTFIMGYMPCGAFYFKL